MCGIAGVVGDVRPEDRQAVRVMCSTMRHRGPDAEGYHEGAFSSLGMRRLSIIDVAHGAQPVHSEDRSVVGIFNGEIYNYRDLQASLRARGHRLASESDSECLPHLYEDRGASLVDVLRGMFTIALWDERAKSLLLARDRVGKKPLYYWEEEGRLWFASELKCLLALPHFVREIDLLALDDYLTYQYVPAPRSIFRGVRKLPPAHRLTWHGRVASVERYWRLEYPVSTGRAAYDEIGLEEELRQLLLDATRMRMVAERPLGAFLSGGLDSSAVVAAMAMQSPVPVSTFSIGFDDEVHNELPYARRVAEHFSTDHHELVVNPDVCDLLPRLARMFDEPFADSSAVPSFYVAEMASQDVVVVLDGNGADESLAGYERYVRFKRRGVEQGIPRVISRIASRAAAAAVRRPTGRPLLDAWSSMALRASARDSAERYGRQVSHFTLDEKRALYRRDVLGAVARHDSYDLIRDIWEHHSHTDLVNKLLAVDMETYLPGDLLPKVDITTMAVSLEARSPFLDHEFLEWAAALPGHLKLADGHTKVLLKRAVTPWLPADLIHRSKMGFAIPLERWLREDLQDMVHDVLLSDSAHCMEWLEPREVKRLLAGHRRWGVGSSKVWSLLMLELFLRVVAAEPEGGGIG